MTETTTLDEYRTGYIAARWDVSDNCARALQLFELGFTCSGAASKLGLTESTVSRYHSELSDKIHKNVVWPVTPAKPRFDVYGPRSAKDYPTLGYDAGKSHGKAVRTHVENLQATESPEQVDPRFREQPPRNKGCSLADIRAEDITIKV